MSSMTCEVSYVLSMQTGQAQLSGSVVMGDKLAIVRDKYLILEFYLPLQSKIGFKTNFVADLHLKVYAGKRAAFHCQYGWLALVIAI